MIVNFTGNLTRNVLTKKTKDDKNYVIMDVAVDVYGKDTPMYITVFAFGALSKYCSKLCKGCRVNVSGSNYYVELYTTNENKNYVKATCNAVEINAFSNNESGDKP